MLGLSPKWVCDHAGELGALRVGDGPRRQLRFDRRRVIQALERRRVAAPAHAASRHLRPDGPMFPTNTGGRANASSLRNRLLINEPADKDGLRYAVNDRR
jgi:hypothetical protein